jgi:protease IV
MRPKLTSTWIEIGFLLVCLLAGLAIAMLYTPEPIQPVVGTLRFEGLIDPLSATQMVEILDEARRDSRIAAVVLEIDSYGGVSTSSESIYHAMLQLRQEKPVIVVVDGAATSGAYLIAVGGSHVMATESSEVGNVGAWTMRPTDPQLYSDVISSGPFKLSGGSRFDAIHQLQLVRDAFTANVVHQRQLSQSNPLTIDQTELAEGKVYLGTEAVAIGLIDELGAGTDGILTAAEAAGLKHYRVRDLPEYLDKPLEPAAEYFLQKMLARPTPGAILLIDSRVLAAVKLASLGGRQGTETPWRWQGAAPDFGQSSLLDGGER